MLLGRKHVRPVFLYAIGRADQNGARHLPTYIARPWHGDTIDGQGIYDN
jgi:hypothetical protein